jgi:hypothetical protein
MYICLECGSVFSDAGRFIETHGLERGPYEHYCGCPHCGGGFEEAVECSICGEMHPLSEDTNGVCADCIDSKADDLEFCYKVSQGEKIGVEINLLMFYLFTEEEMNEILMEAARKRKDCEGVSCASFINDRREWFAEKLEEEVT